MLLTANNELRQRVQRWSLVVRSSLRLERRGQDTGAENFVQSVVRQSTRTRLSTKCLVESMERWLPIGFAM
jgi:hypothetical protein